MPRRERKQEMEDIMTVFLREQLEEQRTVIKANERFMAEAPEGRLKVRQSKESPLYYHMVPDSSAANGMRELSLMNEEIMLRQLVQKEVSTETIKRAQANIKLIGDTMEKYKSLMPADVKEALKPQIRGLVDESQQKIFRLWENEEYDKREQEPGSKGHITHKGEEVSSKSEMTIANDLYDCHIPYHYDENTYILSPRNHYYYVDFKILLPNGEFYYWEHFGLLNKRGYFEHNLEKLYRYHMHGIDMGKNLIITVDGPQCECDSSVILSCIENILMPYYR